VTADGEGPERAERVGRSRRDVAAAPGKLPIPLHGAWTVLLTALWAGPLLAFAALHSAEPPPGGSRLAVMALAAAGLLARRGLPHAYFDTTDWERSGAVYRRLGVRRFGRVVPHGALLNRFSRRRGAACASRAGTAAARTTLEQESCASEATHLWWLLTTLAFALWALLIGRGGFAGVLLLVSVPLNVYPILLQRDTRARLRRIAAHRPPAEPPGGR
jgi:hypothetical protein